MLPPVRGLVENSLIEWPGKISTVIFLAGCNFRCPFCHSRSLVLERFGSESIPFDSVRELLTERVGWIDGAVVTGGEPTIVEGISELMLQLKNVGMMTRINTNGSRPRVLKKLAGKGLLDSVAMDVKAPLNRRYDELAGVRVDLDAIIETIEWLKKGSGLQEVEFRTTVIPGMLSSDDVLEIAKQLGPEADYVLQPFRPLNCLDHACSALPPVKSDDLLALARQIGKYVRTSQVRGLDPQRVSNPPENV